uniref:non-reducing end alpha-L-arabinofuranosidase n=1 Tax=Oryza brachyantha TaxID=4533 RepID=G2XM35_ORYBR|nr:hypothetical_protein [Oryza brachyantha]
MDFKYAFFSTMFSMLLFCFSGTRLSAELELAQTALVEVDVSWELSRKIPDTLFGLFFEEINHAGAGGIWAELVGNRGFEAGGPHTPSDIDPWSIIGDDSSIYITTDRSSCFSQNSVALRMEILCDNCPAGGVGIYNPGFWGMGGALLKVIGYGMLLGGGKLLVHGNRDLGTLEIKYFYGNFDGKLAEDLGASPIWVFNAGISHHDEVDTTVIEPFVKPMRVFSTIDQSWNLNEQSHIICALDEMWLKDVLDSLEFARGSEESTWGSVRATMGHPERFPVKYVAIGNEDCGKEFYRGNYLKFYEAIREAYPDIQMISNCDGSSRPLDHPADLYDFHVYTSAANLFLMKNKFDRTSRIGPKVFVSEYAVNEPKDTGKGSLLASLAEAAFLTGLEKNSDVVQMASYAPLFVNDNDRTWNPDAIVFNSWQQYGTPSYWMQTYFRESSGSVIHPITINSSYSDALAASAITWQDAEDIFLRVKIVNFGPNAVNLTISSKGLQAGVNTAKSTVTTLTSGNLLDENSFTEPNKVVPVTNMLPDASEEMQALLAPYSFTSFDLALDQYSKLVAEM